MLRSPRESLVMLVMIFQLHYFTLPFDINMKFPSIDVKDFDENNFFKKEVISTKICGKVKETIEKLPCQSAMMKYPLNMVVKQSMSTCVAVRLTNKCCAGWQGAQCDKSLCSKGCNVGKCIGVNQCQCPSNYIGQFCERIKTTTRSSRRFTVVNNTYWIEYVRGEILLGRHVRTFDGSFYNYAFRGSYTLFQDIRNVIPKFYVFVNVSSVCQDKRNNVCDLSLTITTATRMYTFRSNMDFLESYDGRNLEMLPLPFSNNLITASRYGSYILISGFGGMHLLFDGKQSIYAFAPFAVQRSLAGLLGYFDGSKEKSREFLNVNQVYLNDLEAFVNAWRDPQEKINYPKGFQQPDKYLEEIEPEQSEKVHKLCSSFLRKGSPLGDICGDLVNVEQTYELCVKELSSCLLSDVPEYNCVQTKLCPLAQHYSLMCTWKGRAVDWRNEVGQICETVQCVSNQVYLECGSNCDRQCGQYNNVQECKSKCTPGCYCPSNLYWNGTTCIPLVQCPCVRDGSFGRQVYPQGYSLRIDCEKCQCGHYGRWNCTELTPCPPGRCLISGHSHIVTFDTNHIYQQEECEMIAIISTSSNDQLLPMLVTIRRQRTCGDDSTEFSCIKEIQIILGVGKLQSHWRFQSLQDIRLNDESVVSPAVVTTPSLTTLRMVSSRRLLLENSNGFSFIWDGKMEIEFHLNKMYRNKVKGVCSNFNANPNDDEEHWITFQANYHDFSEMFPTWKSVDNCYTNITTEVMNYEKVCALNDTMRKMAEMQCHGLYSRTFEICDKVVNADHFVKQCTHDICQSFQPNAHCSSFDSYVRHCHLKGVESIFWRNGSQCPTNCLRGMDFSQCGSKCRKTCFSLQLADCKEECVYGCQCTGSKVFDENISQCVEVHECTCTYQGRLYTIGEKREEQCNECTCSLGGWNCTKLNCTNVCPGGQEWMDCNGCLRVCVNMSIECPRTCSPGCYCPKYYVWHNGTCMKKEECPCSFNKTHFTHGQYTVQGPLTCQRDCICFQGEWRCSHNPQCNGICYASGDSHYETFDTKQYDMFSTCSHILVQNYCQDVQVNGTFRVLVQNVDCIDGRHQCFKKIVIEYRDKLIQLIRGHEPIISYNPYWHFNEKRAFFEYHDIGTYVIIYTEENVSLKWNKKNFIAVTVPVEMQRRVCGLCGNFDIEPANDMRAQTGELESDVVTFANSWKYGENCPPTLVVAVDQCVWYSQREVWAREKCQILYSQKFYECRSQVNVASFYQQCYSDLCGCGNGDDCSCFCTIMEQYVARCNAHGIDVDWRRSEECPFKCSGGSEYKSCGHVCPSSCFVDKTNRSDSFSCNTLCEEGCYCGEGFTWERNQCVPMGMCGCEDENGGIIYANGELLRKECQTCFCNKASLICHAISSLYCSNVTNHLH